MRRLFTWSLCVSTAASVLMLMRRTLDATDVTTITSSTQTRLKQIKTAINNESPVGLNATFFSPTTVPNHATPISHNNPDRRPWALVHIGPHKTGTSSLQCELTFLKEALRDKASTEYIGRLYGECLSDPSAHVRNIVDTRSLVKCLDKHSDKKPCSDRTEWKNFKRLLEKLAANQTNIILSDEAFSRVRATDSNLRLFNRTLSEFFRVQLVVVYRRYWEWLLSMYNEKYKPYSRRQHFQKWPDEHGGASMRSFPDYYRRLLKEQGFGGYQLLAQKLDMPAAMYLSRELFGKHFDKARVFNMHQPGSLFENFVNATVPDLQYVLAQQVNHPAGRPNPSVSLDYDLLATAARKKGLLRISLRRRDATRAIEKKIGKFPYSNETISVPLDCLTDQEQAGLLNRSLTLERNIFPDMVDEWTETHKAEFAKASTGYRFCNVDTDKAIADPEWRHFFQSL